MLPSPFRILYELFVFALQAAFLYGLALIAAIVFIACMLCCILSKSKLPYKNYTVILNF